jgi:hypothetical protein
MRQEAADPDSLAYLVKRVSYRPGWTFKLADIDRGQGSAGLTLIITTRGYDSYHPARGENYRVNHYMPVPPAAYDIRSWQRWLFDQLQLVERHEAMEFFAIHDAPGSEHAVRPYAPSHGPGNDPYIVREVGTDVDRRTSFRGEMNDG